MAKSKDEADSKPKADQENEKSEESTRPENVATNKSEGEGSSYAILTCPFCDSRQTKLLPKEKGEDRRGECHDCKRSFKLPGGVRFREPA
jgi:transposase-like protein